MSNCTQEIVGVQKITLYINKNVLYNYPNISNENEVNITVNSEGSVIIEDIEQYPKWERIFDYSENYKQNHLDEFTFLLHGIKNDVPDIIKDLRNNRLGFICVIKTTGNDNYVFQSPVFLDSKNIKQIDSHSWEVSLSYRVPTFENKLTVLSTTLT